MTDKEWDATAKDIAGTVGVSNGRRTHIVS